MRLFQCLLLTLTTLFGFGLQRLFSCFVLVVSFIPNISNAAAYVYNDVYGPDVHYSTFSASCAAVASSYGYTLVRISGVNVPNRYGCYMQTPSGQNVDTGGMYVADPKCTSDCPTPDKKCVDAAGPSRPYTWTQSSGVIPKKIGVNGCELETSGVGICTPQADGTHSCTSDVAATGLVAPVEPEPTPDPGTEPDTGGGSGGGGGGGSGGGGSSGGGSSGGGSSGGGSSGGGSSGGDSGGGGSSGGGSSGGGSSGGGSSGGGSSGGGSSGGGSSGGGSSGGGSSGGGSSGGGSSGGGSGGGSGSGTCEGDNCGEDEAQVSGDMQCQTVVSCSGDVIQCAVLRQEQQSRCADKEWRDLSDKKVAELKSSLESEFSAQDYQPIKPTAETTFNLSSMIDTSSRFSASCPALPIITVPFVNGTSFQFNPNFDGLCTFLTYMGYLMVAFAMRRAAEIIATGV